MRERLAVGKDDVRDGIGVDVLEPVLPLQAELVVAEHRIRLDQRVARRADVEREAGNEQLLCRRRAARDLAGIEDQAFVAGLREVRRRDQAVVAGAGDDDVGCRRQCRAAQSFRSVYGGAIRRPPSASVTALATAASVPIAPPSPIPFAPRGFVGVGVSTNAVATGGISAAVSSE